MKITAKAQANWYQTNTSDIQSLQSFCKKNDGKELTIEFKVKSNSRSVQANRFYFGVVIKAFERLNGYQSDSNHRLLKEQFLKYRRPEEEIEAIKQMKQKANLKLEEADKYYIKSSADLKVIDFIRYIDLCLELLYEYGGHLDMQEGSEYKELKKDDKGSF